MYESYKIHKKIKYDGLTRKKTYNYLTSEENDNSEKFPSHLSLNSSSFNNISLLIKEYGSDKGKKNVLRNFNNERSQKKINIREKLKNFLEISPKSEEIINDNMDSFKKLNSLNKNESINVTNKIVNNNTFNTTYNIYKINDPIDKKDIYCKPKQKTFRFSELIKERPINQSMQRLKHYNMITNKFESKTSEKNGIYDSNSHKRIDSLLNKTPKKYQEIIINFNKIDNNNSINFEYIYMLESKNRSILNKINNYDICFNECHDWIEYYFNKNIYDIIISLFKLKRNKNNIINKIKIETLCYFLCYDASFSKNFSQAGILIKTIFNLLHNNFLLLTGFIINNFTSKNNNNDQYNNHLINNLNNLINKELKINLSSQDMNNENCIIDIIEQNYKQINNYYKMIIDNIYNYNFTPSMSSSPVNDINAMNNNKMYKFPHCLSLNLDKLSNNQKLKIISLFFFDAYKLLNNYNILDLKIFYDLYLNKKTINNNSIKYNDNIKQNFNNQRSKNRIGYHYLLSNNFSINNDSNYLLSPIKSYYKYTLMINLDTIVYTDEIMYYYNINFDKAKKKIILRPGLIKFLQEMKQIYELILFCNNSLEYIKKALRHLETNENFFEHILCENQLYFDKDGTIKDLDLLGRNLKHIIIIDSNQNMFKSYKDNVIFIRPFYGNVSDDGNVLKKLTEILKVIRYDIEDVDDARIPLYNHKLEIFTKITNYLF
jgi:FMN phosphatase YigB (HAD superfamily)